MVKDNKFVWQVIVGFIICIGLACTMTFVITKGQVEAGIGAEVMALETQLDTARDSRDSYRGSSLNCGFAYQTMKNFILNGDFSKEDIDDIKRDIKRYDEVCKLVPNTGVGGR